MKSFPKSVLTARLWDCWEKLQFYFVGHCHDFDLSRQTKPWKCNQICPWFFPGEQNEPFLHLCRLPNLILLAINSLFISKHPTIKSVNAMLWLHSQLQDAITACTLAFRSATCYCLFSLCLQHSVFVFSRVHSQLAFHMSWTVMQFSSLLEWTGGVLWEVLHPSLCILVQVGDEHE